MHSPKKNKKQLRFALNMLFGQYLMGEMNLRTLSDRNLNL